MKKFLACSALAGLATLAGGIARADILLLNTVDGGQFEETRPPESAVLTDIDVGSNDVAISGFGTFGQMTAAGNVKWLIFNSAGNLLFSTSAVATAAAVRATQWYDSPLLSFTLLANQTYYMGLISDQYFTYDWEYPGFSGVATPESANGLTAPLGPNGNAVTFADPVYAGPGSVQQSIRIYGPGAAAAVPEPSSVVLLITIVAMVGVLVRRKTKATC